MLEYLLYLGGGLLLGGAAQLIRRPFVHGVVIATLSGLALWMAFQHDWLSMALFVWVAYGYVTDYDQIVSERRERKHGSEG